MFFHFQGITSHGQHTKDTIYKRGFHTSLTYWNVDDSGTGHKGDHTGHTGILCPKCKTAGSNLEFFLSNFKYKQLNVQNIINYYNILFGYSL